MAGYSGTPLIKKLGVEPGARLTFVDPPAGFEKLLGTLPEGARKAASGQTDFSMAFVMSAAALRRIFVQLAKRTAPDGMLWIAWPKKAARMQTDLAEDVVRRIGLAAGLVDVKVCAVDETWSGLKFVFRLKDRNTTSSRRRLPPQTAPRTRVRRRASRRAT